MEVAAFFLISLFCFSVILLVHVLLLRLRPRTGLLASSLVTSAAVLAAFAMLAAQGHFPLDFRLTIFGGTTAFFAYQLFFFLGPVTADRSLTAHLLLYLRDQGPRSVPVEQVVEEHAPREFITKRFDECLGASLIRQEKETLVADEIRKGRKFGMVSFEDDLRGLCVDKKIKLHEAVFFSRAPETFKSQMGMK